ncbi:hypothetical protein [uncultured Stenotrophomonas sp.]|uniref:hypothetical protein n=1 Tax=uncultured Stenotrophomonas sp. TaxID=165438 RepID=UPI0025F402C9|nr:hypothetical protein [uncultured Stenotrophomonas sp.]
MSLQVNMRRPHLMGSLLVLLVLFPFAGQAQSSCEVATGNVRPELIVVTGTEANPGEVLLPLGRPRGTLLFKCDYSSAVEVRPIMPGLKYVQNIVVDGETYRAYEWSTTSPLVVFRYVMEGVVGGYAKPLELERDIVIPFNTSGTVLMYLAVGVIARGGPLVAEIVDVGTVETSVVGDPSIRVSNGALIEIRPSVHSCRVRVDAATSLAPAQQQGLQKPGDTANDQAAPVGARCSSAGLIADVRIEDAMDPGNTSSILTPAVGTSAGGVAIQLLRGGVPLMMGTQWDFTSDTGWSDQDISARYIRTTDALSPGEIVGEAVITANLK